MRRDAEVGAVGDETVPLRGELRIDVVDDALLEDRIGYVWAALTYPSVNAT